MSSQHPAGQSDARATLLAALVEDACDVILSIDPAGTITSWNNGAQRLLGHTEAEMLGKPMLIIVTAERHAAELEIFARAHRGERVDHHETRLQHKDGRFVEFTVAVSPIRNAPGEIIGASMIARAGGAMIARAGGAMIARAGGAMIARAGGAMLAHTPSQPTQIQPTAIQPTQIQPTPIQEERDMLLREMGHRIRNLFALSSGVVALSARFAQTPQDMADTVRSRLDALARAHDLTLPIAADGADRSENRVTLHALVRTVVSPYGEVEAGGTDRVTILGPDVPVSGSAVPNLALLLHEFATNAAKYGALSSLTGHVDVECQVDGDELRVAWRERGGPALEGPVLREGFGTLLGHATVRRQLGGSIAREWNPEGLTIRLVVSLSRLVA